MKRFAALYDTLDATTSTNAKVRAMAAYFASAPPADAAWALWLLNGQRPKRLIAVRLLWEWTIEITALPPWLLEESYGAVGDLAETIALVLGGTDRAIWSCAVPPPAASTDLPLHRWLEELILPLRDIAPAGQFRLVCQWWRELPPREIYVLNKLLTGELRVGVSATLVARALAEVAGVPPAVIAHRLMGTWTPSAESFARVVATQADDAGNDAGRLADLSRPYPYFLASPFEGDPATLGERGEWLAEWKWDGIRAELVRRGGEVFLWSRGEELVTDRFPEIRDAAARLPDGTVLDGEILAWRDARPLPFAVLQRRIGRKTLSARILEEAPAAFMAYDLLEERGADVRETPLAERRARLEQLLAPGFPRLHVSERIAAPSWESLAAARDEARGRAVEGLMLKRLSSPYRVGRKRGDWWKWKIAPLTIDAVLVYAQPGHGRRAGIYTDYTFAVASDAGLVPIAKAYSGLSDAEIDEMDAWIRAHTTEKFGPVRAVEPVQVFELAFEGIALSARHKSGIAVRFPRIARWRRDKPASEADSLACVKEMLAHRK